MNEEQNGRAEPIGQTLRRHGVPEQVVIDVERDYRELAKLMQREQPRTIVLAYTPRLDDDDPRHELEDCDTGGHWTITEQGAASPPLDKGEALSWVAAMLLGAKHPPLRSVWSTERAARRDRARCRDAKTEARNARIELDDERRLHDDTVRDLREQLSSLPWELAHAVFADLRSGTGQPIKPADSRELFAVPLLELARMNGARAAERPLVVSGKLEPGALAKITEDMVGGEPRLFAVFPASASNDIAEVTAAIERSIDATAGASQAPRDGMTSADLERAAAESQDEELEELADMLAAAGFDRSVQELRAWPAEWRIDAQNFANAFDACNGDDPGPPPPAFLPSRGHGAEEDAELDPPLGGPDVEAVPRSMVDGGPPE